MCSCSVTVFTSEDSGKDDDDNEDEEHLETEEGAEAVFPFLDSTSELAADCITSFGGAVTVLSLSSEEDQADDTDKESTTPNNTCQFLPIDPPTPTPSPDPYYIPFTFGYSATFMDHWKSPPFTEEQERLIVAADHPFRDYVLQVWEDMLQSALQQCHPQQQVSMPWTSSEEELRCIFGAEDWKSPTPMCAPLNSQTSQPTKSVVSPRVADQAEHWTTDNCSSDWDFIHKWCEGRDQFFQLQQNRLRDPTAMAWASPEVSLRTEDKCLQNGGFYEGHTLSYLTFYETVHTCDPHTQPSGSGGLLHSQQFTCLYN